MSEQKNPSEKSVSEQSVLLLNKGLLVLNVKKELQEKGYSAIGRITKARQVVSRRQEYCSDLIRVIDEAKLTLHLLAQVQDIQIVGEKILQPEEVISYYNGIFLEQVHQIKDKLLRLVDRLLLEPETAQASRRKDPNEIKIKSFTDKNKGVLEEIGIYDLLVKWSSGDLARTLSKRTDHHHRVSTLKLNRDFQNVQASRIALNPDTALFLSEYGKKRMAEWGEVSFKKWREEMINKLESVLDQVQKNVEEISLKIIDYYGIPTTPEEWAVIMNAYTEFLSSQDIKNQASLDKIPADLKDGIEVIADFAVEAFGGLLSSMYLVGSCARDEFNPGSSDINIYLLVKDGPEIPFTQIATQFPILKLIVISDSAFLLDKNMKHQFICWSDGVLLRGNPVKFNKNQFPKPGSLLALLLNKDSIDRLEEIQRELILLNNPENKAMRRLTREVSKIIMDFDFGVAMSNEPFYSASRKEKNEYVKQVWPEGRRAHVMERLYMGGFVDRDNLMMIIDIFLENARPNYEKLLKLESEVLEENA